METAVKEKLAKAGIDAYSGIERFMGNEALFVKFLRRFPEDPNFGKLEAAVDCGDTKTAFEAAHTLKGVCGNLSMTELLRLVSSQVELLRAGELDEASEMMPGIRQAYENILTLLQEWAP